MRSHSPVQVGNIFYLNGNPPEGALESIAASWIDNESLESAKCRFNAMLAAHGRPHGRFHVSVYFGMGLIDLICRGEGTLRRAPWFENTGEFAILEAHGHEIDGWWMQANSGVLLHSHFGRSLTVIEVACALAGSPAPHRDLIAYLQNHVDDFELCCSGQSVFSLLPKEIQQHMDASFRCGSRKARLSRGDDDLRPFDLYEDIMDA